MTGPLGAIDLERLHSSFELYKQNAAHSFSGITWILSCAFPRISRILEVCTELQEFFLVTNVLLRTARDYPDSFYPQKPQQSSSGPSESDGLLEFFDEICAEHSQELAAIQEVVQE